MAGRRSITNAGRALALPPPSNAPPGMQTGGGTLALPSNAPARSSNARAQPEGAIEFVDTRNDVTKLVESNGKLQCYVNGRLEFPDVKDVTLEGGILSYTDGKLGKFGKTAHITYPPRGPERDELLLDLEALAGALQVKTRGLEEDVPKDAADAAIMPKGLPSYDPQRRRQQEEADKYKTKKRLAPDEKKKGLSRAGRPFESSMRRKWETKDVMHSLEAKIEEYAGRHDPFSANEKYLTREREHKDVEVGARSKELQILDKMKKDEQDGALILPVEADAQAALHSGFREYVDYTVDEVERYNSTMTATRAAEFDWAACGDTHDVPVLRCCSSLHRVDGPRSHIAGLGHGSDDMFMGMDFLRDFCARKTHQPSEAATLKRMALASEELMPRQLQRADNGAPLFNADDGGAHRPVTSNFFEHPDGPQEDDIRVEYREPGCYIERKFGERPWAVEYSVV